MHSIKGNTHTLYIIHPIIRIFPSLRGALSSFFFFSVNFFQPLIVADCRFRKSFLTPSPLPSAKLGILIRILSVADRRNPVQTGLSKKRHYFLKKVEVQGWIGWSRYLISTTSNLSLFLSKPCFPLCLILSQAGCPQEFGKMATSNSSLYSTSLKFLEESSSKAPFQQNYILIGLSPNISLGPRNGWNMCAFLQTGRKCRQPVSDHMDWE